MGHAARVALELPQDLLADVEFNQRRAAWLPEDCIDGAAMASGGLTSLIRSFQRAMQLVTIDPNDKTRSVHMRERMA